MKIKHTLDTKDALFLVQEGLSIAHEMNVSISVAVVDGSGVLLNQARHEDGGAHILSASLKKAFTAYSQKRDTLDIFQGIKNGDIPKDILSLDIKLTSMPGGVVIRHEDEVIGAVGVGGAHGQKDHDIAIKAIERWKKIEKLKNDK